MAIHFFAIFAVMVKMARKLMSNMVKNNGENGEKNRHYSKNGEKIDGKMAERARMVKINGKNREKKW